MTNTACRHTRAHAQLQTLPDRELEKGGETIASVV